MDYKINSFVVSIICCVMLRCNQNLIFFRINIKIKKGMIPHFFWLVLFPHRYKSCNRNIIENNEQIKSYKTGVHFCVGMYDYRAVKQR